MQAHEVVEAFEDYRNPVADHAVVRGYTEDGDLFEITGITVDDGGRVILLKLEIAE